MTQSVFGDRDHSDAAAALLALGQLHLQEQDFTQAKDNLKNSLKMTWSLFGDRDHPDAAAVPLLALGQLHLRTGDISEAKLYLENSLKMKRALIALVQLPPCLHLAKCTCGRKTSPKQKTTWKSL